MLRTLAITTLILAAGSGVVRADADIYRWKDSQGIYHYSDQWVPGSELIKSNRQRPPGADSDNLRPAADSSKSESDSPPPPPEQPSAETNQAVKQDVAKTREKQCKDARDAYQKAIEARRIFKTGKNGEREYISDAEADAYRAQVRSDMDTLCAPAGK